MKKIIWISLVAAVALSLSATTAKTPAASLLPRARDGKPNLSGIWQVIGSANFDLQDHSAQTGVPAGEGVVEGGEIPYQPWALEKKKENFANRETLDPESKCYLLGVPRITYSGHPLQIFQGSGPEKITILYECGHANRFIYMNGTEHPSGHIDWWMGDSRGHWEGDTLVVDNVDFNDRTWFDRAGDFQSEELHVVEHYALVDPDHIHYTATIEDPKTFTKPWSIDLILYRPRKRTSSSLTTNARHSISKNIIRRRGQKAEDSADDAQDVSSHCWGWHVASAIVSFSPRPEFTVR
jgi:hypothetical protein